MEFAVTASSDASMDRRDAREGIKLLSGQFEGRGYQCESARQFVNRAAGTQVTKG
jgi:hypothetical protein